MSNPTEHSAEIGIPVAESDASNYQEHLHIEFSNLPDSWLTQPRLFDRYARMHVDALFARDKAKEFLDLIEARLDTEIRENFTGHDLLKKPTEAGIKAWILQQTEYQEANEAYRAASYDASVMGVARASFEQRRAALEGLTKLWLSMYGNRPSQTMPPPLSEVHADALAEEHRAALDDVQFPDSQRL